ncbi:MAG: hypothetical protein R3F21_21445 [Myxococcota bacterium]
MIDRKYMKSAQLGVAASVAFAVVLAGAAGAEEATPDAPSAALSEPALRLGGTAGIDFGFLHLEGDEVDIPQASNGLVRGRGAVSIPFLDWNSFQVDVIGERPLNESTDDDKTTGDLTFAGHLSHRDPSAYLVGVFGGGGMTFDDGDDSDLLAFYFAGAEAQLYWNAWTFHGQAGYLDGEDQFRETIEDAGFGRAVAGYYYQPNGKVSAELSYLRGDRPNGSGGDGNLELIGWGVKVERFAHCDCLPGPVGISLAYDGYDFQATNETDSPEVHELRLGFRLLFGGRSLLDNDRRAAGLDLPMINRWVSTSVNEIE